MKAYLDGLSDYLIERYRLYIETFLIDLWSEAGHIEFRVGYSLRRDHKLRSITFKVRADNAVNAAERRAVIDALFIEIEDHLDVDIACNAMELN